MAEAKLFVKLAGEATEVDSSEDFKVWTQTSVRKLFPLAFINAVTARCGAFACPTLDA